MSVPSTSRLSRNFIFYLTRFAVAALVVCSPAIASAQAKLSGTQEEIREIVFPRPDQVSIEGKATLTAYKDAHVYVCITSKDSLYLFLDLHFGYFRYLKTQ